MPRALALTLVVLTLIFIAGPNADPFIHAQEPAVEPDVLSRVAIRLAPGEDVELVAQEHGATVRHAIGSLERWWLIEFADSATALASVEPLVADPRVESALLQRRREFEWRTNDPFFADQWHLKKSGTASVDINAEGAWNAGITGSGVKLMVCDDSLEHAHPDIAPNYNATDSFDYNSNDADPTPGSSQEVHGTAVAGLAGASGENGLGVAGVAYEVSLSAIRMDVSFSDAGVASALSHNQADVDIYSNSWGPPPWTDMGTLTRQAIDDGVNNGRGGMGCIYVWASGNGRYWGDNANNDPFQTHPGTISVASIAEDGLVADHSEKGACILVAAPAGVSSGGQSAGGNIVTTDRTGTEGYNGLADDDYTNAFGGTSASCPTVAGVVALILEANPNLTWRDVQHILVESANSSNGVASSGWSTNGVGKPIHQTMGFGCVDAGAAVALAQGWTNVSPQQTHTTVWDSPGVAIPDGSSTGETRTVNVPTSMDVEHVLVEVDVTHPDWDELEISLESPSGTVSKFTEVSTTSAPFPMPPAVPSGGTWEFMTVHNWGEDSLGTWALTVKDLESGNPGTLNAWRIKILGANGTPVAMIGVNGGLTQFTAADATTPSPEQSYSVNGTNLTDDVVVAAPGGFEIATSPGGPWSSNLTLAQSGGTLAQTDVYVRFDPILAGGAPAAGDITHDSTGAVQQTLSVSGDVASTGGGGGSSSSGGSSKDGGGGGCAAAASGSAPLAGLLLIVAVIVRHRRFRRHVACG